MLWRMPWVRVGSRHSFTLITTFYVFFMFTWAECRRKRVPKMDGIDGIDEIASEL